MARHFPHFLSTVSSLPGRPRSSGREALYLLKSTLLALVLTVAGVDGLGAQDRPETLLGRVTGEDGSAVAGAEVVVVRGPDRLTLSARSDSAGAYLVRFAQGTGDYLVHVSAAGWKSFRQRVTRVGADSVIELDVRLTSATVRLAPVVASAQRLKPQRGAGIETGTGAAETLVEGVVGALAPDQVGDLEETAATVPGVSRTSEGIAVLGLSGQSNTTLNGLAFAGGQIPRDARVRTRVVTSTYDPARGGFSGGQVAVELASGGPYSFRRGHLVLDAPALQADGASHPPLNQGHSRVQASLGADGELRPGLNYNVSLQASHRAAGLSPFGRDALRAYGVPADSLDRVLGVLAAAGIPIRGGASTDMVARSATFLGRIDRTPFGERTLGLTGYAHVSESDVPAPYVATPSRGGRNASATATLQGIYSFYFGKDYLNETRSALTYGSRRGSPYLELPQAIVLVPSALEGGSAASVPFAFGGNPFLGRDSRSWTWETTNETQWYTSASRHRVKVHAQSRFDGYAETLPADRLGTYTYPSVEALSAGRPSSFSRALASPEVSGGQWSGALAVGDLWRVRPAVQVLYGARLEANRFTSAPAHNPDVLAGFGARSDRVPNAVHVSPRLGFTWVFGRSEPLRQTVSPLGSRVQGPTGILRGGVGEFRSLLPAALLSPALAATGLPGGARRIRCLGDAVPVPDWAAFLDEPAAVPTSCAGAAGGPAFAESAPDVELFGDGYDAPRSWRANLAWSSRWRKVGFTAEGVYSLGLGQPGAVDLNFRNEARFVLAGEDGRAVFASPSGIVPASGLVSLAESRRLSAFGRVVERRSDLRAVGRQLTLTATPELNFSNYFLSLSYTLAEARATARGFDGAAFGDPFAREWAPANLDVRHQLVLQTGAVFARKYSVTLFGRLQSGLPYTPMVAGDVNADGLANDRAFVFDPAAAGSEVAEGIASLLDAAPPSARECLTRQLGDVAGRNSCRGPWTATLNARVQLSTPLPLTRNRATVAVNVSNPLGGLDRLLHGSDGLRGWGSQTSPDPVLYSVRGFDPASRSFRYAVNPNFGRSREATREPFRITIDVSLDWGRPLPVQQMERSLRPASGAGRITVDSLSRRYARSVPDIYAAILLESDSLLLSPEQSAALRAAQTTYRTKVAAVLTPLSEYLAGLPERFDAAEALRRQETALDEAWEAGRLEGPTIRSILSPLQLRMLPGQVSFLINSPVPVRVRTYR